MIYTAIPFSAIGGVVLLWLRDMPFSISAGVGFIALFGIAVLNGIVMIEHFKSMASRFTSLRELVTVGAAERLRPVLLTASAAALGFLPMALSGSAGAEVQRPLATVVVGGLISATLLTLVVLPVLYVLFNSGKTSNPVPLPKKVVLVILFLLSPLAVSWAQETKELTLEEALSIAEKQNPLLQASQKRLESVQALTGTAWNLGRTEVYRAQDQNDIAENGVFNRVWGIRQGLEFPTIYATQKNFLNAGQRQEEARLEMDIRALKKEVSSAYVQAQYWMELEVRLGYLDSLYVSFARSAARRLEMGDATLLEKLTAESKQKEIGLRKSEAQTEKKNALIQLASLIQWEGELTISSKPVILAHENSQEGHPGISWYEAGKQQALFQTRVDQQAFLPDVKLNLFQGTNLAAGSKIYPGFEVGLGIPLFFGAQSANVKSSKSVQQQLELESVNFQSRLESQSRALQATLAQQLAVIQYYETEGKQLASQLREQAIRSFAEGEIDFIQYVQLIENSQSLELQYLQAKRDYLLNQLELIYFTIS